jgi:hypothetical protein
LRTWLGPCPQTLALCLCYVYVYAMSMSMLCLCYVYVYAVRSALSSVWDGWGVLGPCQPELRRKQSPMRDQRQRGRPARSNTTSKWYPRLVCHRGWGPQRSARRSDGSSPQWKMQPPERPPPVRDHIVSRGHIRLVCPIRGHIGQGRICALTALLGDPPKYTLALSDGM